jgi:hypothetical protein
MAMRPPGWATQRRLKPLTAHGGDDTIVITAMRIGFSESGRQGRGGSDQLPSIRLDELRPTSLRVGCDERSSGPSDRTHRDLVLLPLVVVGSRGRPGAQRCRIDGHA